MTKSYEGIKFPEGLCCSFQEFTEQYEKCHIFKAIPSDVRLEKLKEAYKIAVPNGSIKATSTKSTKPNTSKGKK
ncbi:hypothetical protein [Tenacibaculum sp. C7A-26P2]|uniref:hypothetical protein n=1 Tax=Tenacibaculum sp. C7A-26P2 TaxID=3447504 RepID=UPI003F8439AE